MELLIYIAIFAITAGLLTGILYTVNKTQTREQIASAVNQELNFVMQTIQRLVRESSEVETPAYPGSGPKPNNLTLRFKDQGYDPTIISADANSVYVQQGATPPTAITSSQVKVNSLEFTKFDNAGGQATVQVDLTLAYNSTNPNLNVVQTLSSAIGRVTAATFDSDVVPQTPATKDIGSSTLRWRSLSLSRLLYLGAMTDATASEINESTVGALYFNTTKNELRLRNNTGWQSVLTPPTGFAQGDLIVGGVSGAVTRLPAGSPGDLLKIQSGSPAWVAPDPGESGQSSFGGDGLSETNEGAEDGVVDGKLDPGGASPGTASIVMNANTPIIVKNYTEIILNDGDILNLTGTKPEGGVTLVLRSQGNVSITGTAQVNLNGMGGSGGNGSSGGSGSPGQDNSTYFDVLNHFGSGSSGATGGAGGLAVNSRAFYLTDSINNLFHRLMAIVPGSGGGGAIGVPCVGGAGGAGGGALLIEVGGVFTFTGTINANGNDGTGTGGCVTGGGGGGAGGFVAILYNNNGAATGTINAKGGDGGSGSGLSGTAPGAGGGALLSAGGNGGGAGAPGNSGGSAILPASNSTKSLTTIITFVTAGTGGTIGAGGSGGGGGGSEGNIFVAKNIWF